MEPDDMVACDLGCYLSCAPSSRSHAVRALDRRAFLGCLTAAAVSPARVEASGRSTDPRPGAPRRFDLLVRGGRLIDPAAGVDGPRDIGITGGRVATPGMTVPNELADLAWADLERRASRRLGPWTALVGGRELGSATG
jgi:hypothetical protein